MICKLKIKLTCHIMIKYNNIKTVVTLLNQIHLIDNMLFKNSRFVSGEDMCVTSNCSHTCSQLTWYSYQCGCPEGFRLDEGKHTCENFNECEDGITTCEHICTDTSGSFNCSCRSGYRVINGIHCEDIDECLDANGCQQMCTNTAGSYTCTTQEENTISTPGK